MKLDKLIHSFILYNIQRNIYIKQQYIFSHFDIVAFKHNVHSS